MERKHVFVIDEEDVWKIAERMNVEISEESKTHVLYFVKKAIESYCFDTPFNIWKAIEEAIKEEVIMPKTTFEPPRCPNCGANLFRVKETTYETYTWNAEKGVYESDGEAEIKCPDCNADLYDVFPDGVCNYSAKKEILNVAKQNHVERRVREQPLIRADGRLKVDKKAMPSHEAYS